MNFSARGAAKKRRKKILQLAKGYAIISNGGYEITPTLIKDNTNKKIKRLKVLSNDVSKKNEYYDEKSSFRGNGKISKR